MNLQTEAPEKKKKKTNDSPSPPSFDSLPDEIILTCLARIPRSCHTTLSAVSTTFKSILSSTELYAVRSRLGIMEHCIYVPFIGYGNQYPQWFRLWINPNQTITNLKNKTTRNLLVPVSPSNIPSPPQSALAVGSEIYVVGEPIFGKMRVLDCRSNTWRDAPSMNVARMFPSTIVYDGRIYVMGGCKGLEADQPWAEVFDIKTQTWKLLPDPGIEVRTRDIHGIMEMDGKIKFRSGEKIHGYDTKQGKWECYENESDEIFSWSRCVIENVLYRCNHITQALFEWYDVKDEKWKGVKGLESLRDKYQKAWGNNGGSYTLVSCGGKLFFIWGGGYESYHYTKFFWCAEIVMEHRYGGEVWGNVEWYGVVHTVPTTCYLFRSQAVSF